ncbi:diadenylate cyclase [Aeromonas veronii]|uniref:diadenylate cyclase n=1 Tax=Aeromonas veronii TaxID=654 RepID=UPI00301BB143
MDNKKALNVVIDMVPNWYQAECGYYKNNISIGWDSEVFFTERRLTPLLNKFLITAEDSLPELLRLVKNIPDSMATEIIQESLAKKWLEQHEPRINWSKIFSYNRDLDYRTYENSSISINLLIKIGCGDFDLTDTSHYKIIDPLASNLNVYFEVNEELCYRDYNYISWGEVKESQNYKFLPEFLHPFQGIKDKDDWSIHKTSRGDLVILDKDGLRATKRKGKWTIYDPPTIKNMIVDIIGQSSYWVACNLFEVLLDLSYKRHGALLIYDNLNAMSQFVTNKESLLFNNRNSIDIVRKNMISAIGDIAMGSSQSENIKKRLLIELASMDGAVIYSDNRLKGFGCMIQAHPAAGEATGARTTAALSSYLYGGFAVKVSTDGEITIFFTSRSQDGKTSPAKLSFL